MVEIDFGAREGAVFDFHRRFRLVQRGDGLVEIGGSIDVAGAQFLRAPRVDLRQLETCLGTGEVALGLEHDRLIHRRVDLRNHLVGLHG